MSLEEVRNQLLISHDDSVINFDFDDLADDECLSEFRF